MRAPSATRTPSTTTPLIYTLHQQRRTGSSRNHCVYVLACSRHVCLVGGLSPQWTDFYMIYCRTVTVPYRILIKRID
jgi:hypothetical protein